MTRTHKCDSKINHIINDNMSGKVGSFHSILKAWLNINSVGIIRKLLRNAESQGRGREVTGERRGRSSQGTSVMDQGQG